VANISFIPLPEMGHINPTLKLAKQLAQRGHRVSYLGLPDFEEHVRSRGLGFVPILTSLAPLGTLKRLAEQKLNYLDMLFRVRDPPVRELAEAIGTLRPDLLLIDIVLQDLTLLARAAGVPCAILSTSLHQSRLTIIETIHRFLSEDHPLLILCPQAFDFPQVPPREGRYYLEASIDLERGEPGGFPWDRIDGSRPLVYCSLGSHPHDYEKSEAFFQAVLDAARQRPEWQLVLAAGQAYIGSPLFRDVPPNVVAVDWVPQLAMLKKAAVMITHGGLGTIKECIYFGVPMIVFPMAFDQPENAERIAWHGLGLRGSTNDVSAAQVLHLVDRVLADAAFGVRATSMSAVFRELETSGIGARVVEALLGGPGRIALV
jgi:UDP:flavonoid glycosyltransferase YjiC (YdhE family)